MDRSLREVDLAQTLYDAPGSEKVAGLLNPALAQTWNDLNRETPYGQDAGSYHKALVQAGERLAPDYGLAQDFIHPPGPGGLYPDDQTRLGRLARASGVVPIPIDPEQAFQARVRAGIVSKFEVAEHNLIRDSRAAGLGDPTPEVLFDLVCKIQLDHAIKHGQSYMERVQIAAALFDQRYGTREAEKVNQYVRTEGDAKAYYYALRPQLYPTYQQWDAQVQHILDAQLEAQPIG